MDGQRPDKNFRKTETLKNAEDETIRRRLNRVRPRRPQFSTDHAERARERALVLANMATTAGRRLDTMQAEKDDRCSQILRSGDCLRL